MSVALKIGKKSITPKRAKDKRGTQGVFLTAREWKTVLDELKIRTNLTNKTSALSGSLLALEEVETFLEGKKKLRNANEALSEL
jgi:hypothetical protein